MDVVAGLIGCLRRRVCGPTPAEVCARRGHDWHIINWIGQGQTRYCRRCPARAGLKSVDADGKVTYW
jgi:hypothetical protein